MLRTGPLAGWLVAVVALAACQSAPPVEEQPLDAEPVLERQPPAEQLEQVFETDVAEARYSVPRADDGRPATAAISPETIALAEEINQPRPVRPPRRSEQPARPATAPTPEETYLLPKAPARPASGSGKGQPLVTGEAVSVALNPYSGGTWISEGANQFWVLRLKSVGASSLSLYFSPLRLPSGSELSIASADGATRHGPYTAADLQGRKEFWTPSVPGDTAVVRLKLPPAGQSGLLLNLAEARVGYRAE